MSVSTPSLREASFKDWLSALKNIPRAFGLLWKADRTSTLLMAALTFVSAILPLSQAWVAKLIVDGVLDASRAGASFEAGVRTVLPYLLIEFALLAASAAVSQLRLLLEELMDHRLGHVINTTIIRKALSLEMKYFEDSEFYDKMQNARRQSEYRAMALVNGGFLLAQNLITLASFLIVIVSFNAWLALLLFGAAVPAFINQSRYSRLNFRLQTWRTPETRQMSYFEQLLTQDATVKEVKLFGLGQPLLDRYSQIFWKIFREDVRIARGRSVRSVLWGLLASVAYYVAYAWIIGLAVSRRISLGDMTLYLTLFRSSQATFQGLLENINRLFENGLFLENLFSFLDLRSQTEVLDQKSRPAEDPWQGIEFRNVSFRYPGKEEWALRDFSLTLAPGEKLALVGENGAGKTTLIKLLTRLYEPTEGQILYHGVDLRYFTPAELNRRMSAIFQDYVRYQLSFKENIGVGSIEHLEDEQRIRESGMKSGADEVAESLPHKWETQLGKWFEDGQELSGGQWQKVALGRAFMRNAEVLILDEPTSALDAAAEYEIFQRFRDLTQGKIAILVSHRFSTVRMADRILVLKAGRIEELGSHSELLARRGTYAHLFELQAEGYR